MSDAIQIAAVLVTAFLLVAVCEITQQVAPGYLQFLVGGYMNPWPPLGTLAFVGLVHFFETS